MNHACPPLESLHAALATNGREPAPRKLVLDGGWCLVDEEPTVPLRIQPASVSPVPATFSAATQPPDTLLATFQAAARLGGWSVTGTPVHPLVELGGKRRARAAFRQWPDRGPALCVEILPEPPDNPAAVAAWALDLTSRLRLVRGSLVDCGNGPVLVWDVPLKPAAITADAIIDALCCLASAVQQGQAEAARLATDPVTAHCWLHLRFPLTTPN